MVSKTYLEDIKYLEEKIQLIEFIEQFSVSEETSYIAPFENNEVKSFNYFSKSLSQIKKKAQEVYAKPKLSYGMNIYELLLLNSIEYLRYDVEQYFALKGNKVLRQIQFQKYKKQIDSISFNMDKITPEKINEQLDQFLENYRSANISNFDKTIIDNQVVNIILKLIEKQVSKDNLKLVDLSLITKYGMENELLHSIKILVLERAKNQAKDKKLAYLELFNELNINDLANPQLWKRIFSIDTVEIVITKQSKDTKKENELDTSIENQISDMSIIQSGLSFRDFYKIFRKPNISYFITSFIDNTIFGRTPIHNGLIDYLRLRICDTKYTFATINEDTKKYEDIIAYGRLSDFRKLSLAKRECIVEIETNASCIDQGFKTCKNLRRLILLDNVIQISNNAFTNCTKLSYVKLGSHIKCIGANCFYNTSIEEITIPNTTETIGVSAFRGCSNLRIVDLGNGIKTIGNYAFYSTAIEKISIPDSTETIGDSAFESCSNLRIVDLGNGIKTICGYAFCNTAIEKISIPDSTETILDCAFYGCDNLRIVDLGNGIKTIGNYAFCNTAIEKISIPDSTETIGNSAFESCSNLRIVDLGNGIKTIGRNCFGKTRVNEISISDEIHVDTSFIERLFGLFDFPKTIYSNNCSVLSPTHCYKYKRILDVPIEEKDSAAEIISRDIANYIEEKEQETR